jgi:hypothetical protein
VAKIVVALREIVEWGKVGPPQEMVAGEFNIGRTQGSL